MYRGNFANDIPGQEYLILNKYFDWVLLDKSGNLIHRLFRGPRCLSPGLCDVVRDLPPHLLNEAGNGGRKVIIPGLDGHVWYLEWDESDQQLALNELVGFTHRALYRVTAVDADGDGEPERLILLGRNSSLAEVSRIMLYDLATETMIDDIASGPNLDQAPSFAWVQKPEDVSDWCFALGSKGKVGVVCYDSATDTLALTDEIGPGSTIVSLEFLAGTPGPGVDADFIGNLIVALSNGEIHFLNVLDSGTMSLDFSRQSNQVATIPAGESPQPWYSNFTLAHEAAFELWEEPINGEAYLYVAEMRQKFTNDSYRVARLDVLRTQATPNMVIWHPFEFAAKPAHALGARNNRFLHLVDTNPQSPRPEDHILLQESGAVLDDNGTDRLFCTRTTDLSLVQAISPFGGSTQFDVGGYLFEALDLTTGSALTNDYSILTSAPGTGEFTVPNPDSAVFYENPDAGAEDIWWNPRVGTNIIRGQIASHGQLGTSMTTARLRDPDNPAQFVDHIVTGTKGGSVYAVIPGPQQSFGPGINPADNNETLSRLTFASADLGWWAIGLDAGDLDGDSEDEIVVGTFVDDGRLEDWRNNQWDKNRGILTILEPSMQTWNNGNARRFRVVAELTADDLPSLNPGEGLGAGVFGVKIDDVNNDGSPEIWCGDAVGHIYLFKQDNGVWSTVYRSDPLGAYAGYYNNIFPIKDTAGNTNRLAVVSCGYVMAFDVDFASLNN